MTVSVPVVFLFGALAYIAWKYLGLRLGHALVCLLFGFFLAATSAAPEIRQIVSSLLEALPKSQP